MTFAPESGSDSDVTIQPGRVWKTTLTTYNVTLDKQMVGTVCCSLLKINKALRGWGAAHRYPSFASKFHCKESAQLFA